MRSVATIDAQPAVAPRPPAPAREPDPVPSADPTMLRGAKNVVAQPPTAPPRGPTPPPPSGELPTETVVRRREPAAAPPEPPAAVAPSRKKNFAGWIIGGIAVLLGAGITAAIVFGGMPTLGTDEPKPTSSAAPVIIDSIPTPQVAGAPAVDGSTITWTFTNPEPKDGDFFYWRISNRTSEEPNHKSDDNTVVVNDYAPGSTVCVSVSISRNGKLSAKPYETCYPA